MASFLGPVNGKLTIGTTSKEITVNGSSIKQIVPVSVGTIETVIGNTDTASSMSTTFCRKKTVSGVLGTPNPLQCYTIISPIPPVGDTNGNFVSQYFELVVSGSNNTRGGYSYKGCFCLNIYTKTIVAPSVNTLFFSATNGTVPSISFNIVNTDTFSTVTLSIDTTSGSTDQQFISTLIAYPTLSIFDGLNDYSISAIP